MNLSSSSSDFVLLSDIVDIKPVNMEELTEVITAAEFHPINCNQFVYSSSKGTIKLADMRDSALCDQHAKREYQYEMSLSTFASSRRRLSFRYCFHSITDAYILVLLLLSSLSSFQNSRKRKIHQTNPSSRKSFHQSQTSNFPEMVDISYHEII